MTRTATISSTCCAISGRTFRVSTTVHRHISVSPGRSYKGTTTDGGVSLQIDNDFGFANLTSITAYRGYKSEQNGDFDYSTVDILYRKDPDPNYRKFRTFSQELRLQGSAFGDNSTGWSAAISRTSI